MRQSPSRVPRGVAVPEVRVRRLRFAVALLGVTLVGVSLGGCSTDLTQLSTADLNPFKGNDPFRASDYNYFYRGDASISGPVTAADLVGPDGRCAFAPAPPPMMPPGTPSDAPVAAAPATDPINPQSNGALYFTARPQSGPPAAAPPSAMPPE